MKLKLNEQGNVVLQDDKPVYIADDGKEVAFDYPATLATIARLNKEAKDRREHAEALEAKFKPFEGIEDPAQALKALDIVKNLDDKKLIEAGEVDKVRQEAKAAYDEQVKSLEKKYKPIEKERDGYKAELEHEILGTAFSRSKYIAEKLAVPVDMVQATFGKQFVIEPGKKIVALDAKGERIFSRARPGEIANFDEALEALVEEYPNRDNILKGSGASGSGASNGRTVNGKKAVSRAQFDEMSPADRMTTIREGVAVVD